MKRITAYYFVFCLFVLTFLVLVNPSLTFAQGEVLSSLQQPLVEVDPRVLALRYYLLTYDSPLQNHADELIEAADRYQMDWRLMPAIAAVESNFGHRIPGGKDPDYTSFNAWGWGVYGKRVIRFGSWSEGINRVSKGIKERFIDQGMSDPYTMNIRYSTNPDWGWQVEFFINEIEAYQKAFMGKFAGEINSYNQMVRNLNAPQRIFHSDVKVLVNNHSLSLINY